MASDKRRRIGFFLFIAAIVLFRFAYSLTTEFWWKDEDVIQIYLIGLKSFTTHTFPYFGADLVYNGSQIPGALQGILVSAGWYVWQIPEAPYIVLNTLLTASLGLLAWYASKRLPDIPKVFIWSYIFLIPWSICFFTRLVNPSYVIPGAILFFIGIFKFIPTPHKKHRTEMALLFMLGFGIFWVIQLHMSWPLLIPFTLLACLYQLRKFEWRRFAINSLSFIAGCLATGSLLIPTLLRYGLASDRGKSVAGMVEFHPEHAASITHLLTTYLAYASFDATRFIGPDTTARTRFLSQYFWAAPFTIFVAVVGVLQLLFLLYRMIWPGRDKSLRPLAWLALGGFLLFFAMSLFSRVDPPSHAAVLYFPLVTLFALHAFRDPLKKKWLSRIATITFFSAAIMYTAIAIKNFSTISLYQNRDRIVQAIAKQDYRIVGLRRYEKK